MAAPARTPNPLTFASESPQNQKVDTASDLPFSRNTPKPESPQIRPTHQHFPCMETRRKRRNNTKPQVSDLGFLSYEVRTKGFEPLTF